MSELEISGFVHLGWKESGLGSAFCFYSPELKLCVTTSAMPDDIDM